MFRIIETQTGRLPCVKFTCQIGSEPEQKNDIRCIELSQQALESGSDSTGIQMSVPLEAIANNERREDLLNDQVPDNGCFDVYSVSQQDESVRTAQTAFFVCIVIVQMGGLLMCKTRVLLLFKQGMTNWILNLGLVTEVALFAALCYTPFIQTEFETRPLRFMHWLPAIPFSKFVFFYDELRKLVIRLGDRRGNKVGIWLRETLIGR